MCQPAGLRTSSALLFCRYESVGLLNEKTYSEVLTFCETVYYFGTITRGICMELTMVWTMVLTIVHFCRLCHQYTKHKLRLVVPHKPAIVQPGGRNIPAGGASHRTHGKTNRKPGGRHINCGVTASLGISSATPLPDCDVSPAGLLIQCHLSEG